MQLIAFAVLLLAVIKQCCIAAGAPFWIGGELPVFVIRPHAPNRDACTETVRYEYMYRATPNMYVYVYVYVYVCVCNIYIYIYIYILFVYVYIQVHLNELECREKVHFFLASYFKK